MALDIDRLGAYRIPDTAMTLTRRDTVLYALGMGLGADPVNEGELRFVYEKDLAALPTMATIIAAPHAWIEHADVGSSGHSVHAGIAVEVLRPIPVDGSFEGRNRFGEIVNKGAGEAALVTTEREVFDAGGEAVFRSRSTSMLRGDGGFGGSPVSTAPAHKVPDGAPDLAIDMPALPQSGLIHRLSRDSAACRPRACPPRRLRPADPARAVHLRRRRPCAPARAVRL